jgi:hypothetical protein
MKKQLTHVYYKKLTAFLREKIRTFFLVLLFCSLTTEVFATVWTTGVAGAVNDLANWTDGSVSPSTFTTPGDTWNITMAMTMPMPGTWTVGTAAMAHDTVTFASGGTVSMSGAGSTSTITINGDVFMNGGALALGGAGTTNNNIINGSVFVASGTAFSTNGATSIMFTTINGNYSMSGGTVSTGGASGAITMTINGIFNMSGGVINTNGAGCRQDIKIKGNGSFNGPSAVTNTGAGCTSVVHFSLPNGAGTMLIDNTSTGTWSATNVFVDTNCTTQLDGNFSTNTGITPFPGGPSYGLTVDGTLICPSVYTVTGFNFFTLHGVATLEVAHATGINGAIVTTGTKTFATSANYAFNGTVAQVTGSYLPLTLVSPDTITISNSAGVTLSQTTLTTGALLFTSGILNTTPAYTMSVPGTASAVVGAGASSYVNGTLIKTISGLTSVNYEVGDMDYAPMSLTLSSAGTSGSLGLKTTNGLHPSVSTSGLSAANMANHYWTITNYSTSGPATVIAKATYNLADIIGGSNTSFQTQEYNGTAWLGAPLTTANTVAPYTSSPTSGISLATLAGDYIFGNIFCGTLPIASTTAFCAGTTITLSDPTPGGSWVSATTTVATVSSTGVVTGVSGGTATISYTVSGCTVTTVVTVNPLPDAGAITGIDSVCLGHKDTLTDIAPGGVWSSYNTSLATVSATGIVYPVSAGVDTIYYKVTNSCGTTTAKLHVKILATGACHTEVNEVNKPIVTELQVFPNPNTGSFTMNLSSENDEEVEVVITNIVGAKIWQLITTTNKESYIVLNSSPGIYLLSASTTHGRYNAKVIIR